MNGKPTYTMGAQTGELFVEYPRNVKVEISTRAEWDYWMARERNLDVWLWSITSTGGPYHWKLDVYEWRPPTVPPPI